jgi:dolichol-phosphate hexosyltransferase
MSPPGPPPLSLTVVMPLYNEASTVRTSVDRLLATVLPVNLEVIVVDDGSSDGGADTLTDLVDSGSIRLIRHAQNRGKGAAVRTGIARASGDVLTILDADLESNPEDFRELLIPIIEDGEEVVYGIRVFSAHSAHSFVFVMGNKLINFWASLLFNAWLSDVETCFKMARTEIWRRNDLKSDGFGIEAEVTAKFLRAGYGIYEVPIRYKARSTAQGKKMKARDGIEALAILLKVRLFG